MKRLQLVLLTTAMALIVGFAGAAAAADPAAGAVTPEEARAIAKEAYIYGFPVVDK